MDNKISKEDGAIKEVAPGSIGAALREGKSILIVTTDDRYVRDIYRAWADEANENPIEGVTVVFHNDKMHMAFSNGALIQVACVRGMADVERFRGRRYDLLKPAGYVTDEEVAIVEALRAIVRP